MPNDEIAGLYDGGVFAEVGRFEEGRGGGAGNTCGVHLQHHIKLYLISCRRCCSYAS